MKTSSDVIHYATKQDYLNKRLASKQVSKVVAKEVAGPMADKVEVSKKAKGLSEKAESVKENLKQNGKEISQAGERLVKDAAGVAVKALKAPGVGLISNLVPNISLSSSSSTPLARTEETSEAIEKLDSIDKPAFFFITGLHLNGISDDGGLDELAGAVEGGTHFTWKEEDKIVEEILRRPEQMPVVLVGHSLGGDAAVSIANRLNTITNGFRNVDLLVTLDSVGFDNDIIPSNVKKNLNFIGNEDVFFNDGPNIARNSLKTIVLNELRSESHTQIDQSKEIHEKIFKEINDIRDIHKKDLRLDKLNKILATITNI